MTYWTKTTLLLFTFLLTASCCLAQTATLTNQNVTIDGIATEPQWENSSWVAIDQVVLGTNLSPDDFSGRWKAMWDSDYIYLLVEVTDDSLSDHYSDPLNNYWNDDCVEIFIDENNMGENHQSNHNAFAYHVNIFGDVVDWGVNSSPILLNDHITSAIHHSNGLYTWEMRIKVFDDSFNENNSSNTPVQLHGDKTIGFTVGYCDSDASTSREHFILSQAGQGDSGWITSADFGELFLDPSIIDANDALVDGSALLYPSSGSEFIFEHIELATLTILNRLGEVVHESTYPQGTQKIQFDGKPGVYFVTVGTNDNKSIQRILKL